MPLLICGTQGGTFVKVLTFYSESAPIENIWVPGNLFDYSLQKHIYSLAI